MLIPALLLLSGCSRAPRVQGYIIGIEEASGRPTAFTVDTDKGPVRILIDKKINYGFDLKHLEVHRTQALPVDVPIEKRGDDEVALAIYDAKR